MKTRTYCAFVLAWVLFAGELLGQPVEKLKRRDAFWPVLNAEYFLQKGSFFFAEAQLRHSNLPGNTDQISENFPFYRAHWMLGYEQRFNAFWSGGLSYRMAVERRRDISFTRAYLRHTSYFQGIEILKEASFEFLGQAGGRPSANPWGRASISAIIGKDFFPGGLHLRPEASFFAFFNLHEATNANIDRRRIDKTRARFDLLWFPHPQWILGGFAMRDTDYFFGQPVFDADGLQVKPFRRLNLFAPVYGISLRYWFHQQNHPRYLYGPKPKEAE